MEVTWILLFYLQNLEATLEAPRNAAAEAKAVRAALKGKKDEASLNRVKAMGAVGAYV
jgi:hypothetical protein